MPDPQHFVVHLFAAARELAGADRVSVKLALPATVADLRAALVRDFPALASLLAKSAIAINHDFADDDHALAPGDEIAVIPPVSGG